MGRRNRRADADSESLAVAESEGGTMYSVQQQQQQQARDGLLANAKKKKDPVAELLGGKYEPDIVDDVRSFR